MAMFKNRESLLGQFEQAVQKYMDAHEHVTFRNTEIVFALSEKEDDPKEWRFGFVKGFDLLVSGTKGVTDGGLDGGKPYLNADKLYFEDKPLDEGVSQDGYFENTAKKP